MLMNRFLTSWARTAMTLLALFLFLGGARAQKALPYEYGFEDNDLSADGWTATASTSVIQANNSYASPHSGTYYFWFSYDISTNAYLVSPILTGGTNGVDVSFYYKSYSDSYLDHFQVGYTTDENETDPSSFTYGEKITSSTDWQEYKNTFPPGTVRIAILYDTDNYNDGWYL